MCAPTKEQLDALMSYLTELDEIQAKYVGKLPISSVIMNGMILFMGYLYDELDDPDDALGWVIEAHGIAYTQYRMNLEEELKNLK